MCYLRLLINVSHSCVVLCFLAVHQYHLCNLFRNHIAELLYFSQFINIAYATFT
jgi:hypothetical protein